MGDRQTPTGAQTCTGESRRVAARRLPHRPAWRRIRLLGLSLLGAGCAAGNEPGREAGTTHTESADAAERAAQVERSLVPTILIEGEQAQTFTLEERMALHGVPGVSVAVLKDGEVDWVRAYGVADASTARPVSTETLFQAASISKPIAAMAALRLVEDGRLSLDQDVNDQLRSWTLPASEFVADGPGDRVTPRRLLTHTAGLSVSGFPGYPANAPIPTAVDILEGRGDANTDPVRSVTEPGSEWSYSGGGYTVLQVLMEDVSGEPFAELLQSTVLDPLGMDRSFYGFALPPNLEGEVAFGHRPDGALVEGRWRRYPELAAAGLWATPADLLSWAQEVLASAEGRSNRVLSQEMTREMLSPGMGDWGLGPEFSPDGTRFLHTGGNQGYRCVLAVSMDGSVGVAVMTNSDNGDVLMAEIAYAVARVYGWVGEGLEPEVRRVIEPDPLALAQVTGRYPAPGDREVVVTVEDGRLMASSEWFQKQPLFAESTDTYFLRHGGARLRFEQEGANPVLHLYGMRLERAGPE